MIQGSDGNGAVVRKATVTPSCGLLRRPVEFKGWVALFEMTLTMKKRANRLIIMLTDDEEERMKAWH